MLFNSFNLSLIFKTLNFVFKLTFVVRFRQAVPANEVHDGRSAAAYPQRCKKFELLLSTSGKTFETLQKRKNGLMIF